jgi:hypothetical protein
MNEWGESDGFVFFSLKVMLEFHSGIRPRFEKIKPKSFPLFSSLFRDVRCLRNGIV